MIRIRRLMANNFKQLQEIDLFFPERGRFLIQGKNEAGKSNLFEAIFFAMFGEPLVTETPARRFDDLIRYGMERAYVELWLEVRDRLLKVYRTIRRGKANRWKLKIEGPDGIEEVVGNRAVNKRIIAELGLDGEALLNTCFVEQKKLEKLEGMSLRDRERSLMTLLNLDRLVKIEEELKVKGEDRLELERCQRRYELAETQAELPKVEERLAEVEGRLLFISLREKLREIAKERRAIQRLREEIAALERKRESLAQKAKRIEALEEGMRALQEILNYLARVRDQEERIERLQQEIEERERLRREELPGLVEKLQGLRFLRSRLERLAKVKAIEEESEERLASVARVLEEWEAKREQLREEREHLGEIEAQIREEARQGWISVRGLEMALRQKRKERDQLSWRLKLEGAGAIGSLALAVVSLLFYLPPGFVIAAAAFLTLLVLGFLTWRRYRSAAKELERSEWEQKDIPELKQRLTGLGLTPPEEVGELPGPLALLERAREVERSLAQAEARRGEVERRVKELEDELSAYEEEKLREEEASCRSIVEKARGILQRWEAKAERLAAELGVELDIVQGELGRFTAEEQQMRRKVEEIPDKKAEVAERRGRIDRLLKEMEERYRSIAAIIAGAPAWNPSLSAQDYEGLREWLRKEYDELGGETVKRELEEVQGEINSRQGERGTREEKVVQMVREAQEDLAKLSSAAEARPLLPGTGLRAPLPLTAIELSERSSLEEVEELLARLEALDLGDKEALLRERDELRERVGYLKKRRDDLESALGLEGEVLDLELCRRELEGKRHELDVREVAVHILGEARRRMVERVLPSTMEHMRKLLPSLTMDRYYDAELTEEYRIRVWDERANAWKEKNIFSGGTKDQFSLALRLAFALATLPEERGTAPSFIFLDEPLGSFDNERAKALLYLLIEGEIAESFDQIFLISHVPVNPLLFNYHILLDGGKVVESDLPSHEEIGIVP